MVSADVDDDGYDGKRGFAPAWVSDWTLSAIVGALTIADLDGDKRSEFIYNGRLVFSGQPGGGYISRPLPVVQTAHWAVGELPELLEPAKAVRLVPLRWSLPRARITAGSRVDVAITLRSVWGEARDVAVNVIAEDSRLKVDTGGAALRIASIPAGGTGVLPPFGLEATGGPRAGLGAVEAVVEGAPVYGSKSWRAVATSSPSPYGDHRT